MSNQVCFGLLALTACSAQSSLPEGTRPDASQAARTDAPTNNPPPPSPDAALAVADATLPGDACVPQVTQLLVNPAFDAAPTGTGWAQTLIDALSPLITDEDGVVEHTAPYKAWLGGFEAGTGTVTDSLVQNVTIPANTTHLVLTGMYDVRTSEVPSTTAYDTAKLLITEIDGTPIVTVVALSNVAPTAVWTMFGHAFTQNLSGKTVRVRLTSTNDLSDATSFFFDSLALTATHGCAPN